MRSNTAVLFGFCPNSQCGKKLYFPEHEASVECVGCGQRHTPSTLLSVERLTSDKDIVIGIIDALDRLLNAQTKTDAVKKETSNIDSLKVDGMTNCLTALLSPLLTTHGMDKATGKAKLLTEMGKPPVFDCGQLCDRAYLIDRTHLDVPGFGWDRSGSRTYLWDTLQQIKLSNDQEERLVPVHADGDGHCLVHAVSRALIGWELFWHPLRVNLKQHFMSNLDKYKMQFKDFVDESEWALIIDECDPDFVPSGLEPTGLRNIHIFGLANVLRRPIVLLDCLDGIQSSGDYSAIFLPYFSAPSACMNKEGVLNKPLCIAWSSMGRNHFIPLVGVKGRKCASLPRYMIQRCWGVSDIMIDKYVQFDDHGRCQIGGEKVLQSAYIQKLVAAMSAVFYQNHLVSPHLLADMQEQIFKANGLVCGLRTDLLLDKARTSLRQQLLFTCLTCRCLALAQHVPAAWCAPGGELYDLAVSCHGPQLKDGQSYSFPLHNIAAVYHAKQDRLVLTPGQRKPGACLNCSGVEFRFVSSDYTVEYKDGDRTNTKSNRCLCGFKHFYAGKEYDTVPKKILILMEWAGKTVKAIALWFQGEEDESLNSNVYAMAQDLVQSHFPGEFGSERLVQRVVDQILAQTQSPDVNIKKPDISDHGASSEVPSSTTATLEEDMDVSHNREHSKPLSGSSYLQSETGKWSANRASKAILTGLQRQSVHREELNKSAAEKRVRSQIEAHAPRQQQKLSSRLALSDAAVKNVDKQKSPAPIVSPSSSTRKDDLGSPSTRDEPNKSKSNNKRIRLTLSDNRHMTLDLPAECKFLELQTLISGATAVPPAQLRIRHGFPPRELKAPTSPDQDYRVPVQPGDRIMVDVVSQPTVAAASERKRPSSVRKVDPPWRSLAEGGMDEVSDRVLQGLMDPLLNHGGDSLDHSLSALALTAALENRDLWSHVQRLPHLFSVDGAFYRQVERDIGLEPGRHYQVPLLPHKVFAYNSHADRLELCLEPYGHFPVEPNVERNSESMLPTARCSKNKPFSGQGHVLKSTQEERMPTDVPMSPKRHEARRLNTMCDPAVHQESIEEEAEEEEEEESASMNSSTDSDKLNSHRLNPADLVRNPALLHGGPARLNHRGGLHGAGNSLHLNQEVGKLVRRGPGYSELSPIPETSDAVTSPTEAVVRGGGLGRGFGFPGFGQGGVVPSSSGGTGGNGDDGGGARIEMLHQLVSKIEHAVELMGSEAQAISEGRQPTFPGRGNLVVAGSSADGGSTVVQGAEQGVLVSSREHSKSSGSGDARGSGLGGQTSTEVNTQSSNSSSSNCSKDYNASQPHTSTFDRSPSSSSSNPQSFKPGLEHLAKVSTIGVDSINVTSNTENRQNVTTQLKDSSSTATTTTTKRRQLPPTPSTSISTMPKPNSSTTSPCSSSSSSTRSSPERKSVSSRNSGMRNSGGPCKDLPSSTMTHSLESQAIVAALAGQVASDIAAMDTETSPGSAANRVSQTQQSGGAARVDDDDSMSQQTQNAVHCADTSSWSTGMHNILSSSTEIVHSLETGSRVSQESNVMDMDDKVDLLDGQVLLQNKESETTSDVGREDNEDTMECSETGLDKTPSQSRDANVEKDGVEYMDSP